MVQQLYRQLEVHEKEIRRLRGRLDRISSGGVVIGSGPAMPSSIEGAMIIGDATSVWIRLIPPTPAAGEEYVVRFDDGDTLPSWKLNTASGSSDDVFTIGMAAAL